MEAVLEIIAVVCMGLLLGVAAVSNLLLCFAKEKRRNICVIRKRETLSRNLRSYYGGQKNQYTSHYTVDCRYPDSDRIHTLDCSFAIFRQMKEGKSYIVTTKMLSITSIVKKRVS